MASERKTIRPVGVAGALHAVLLPHGIPSPTPAG